MDPVMSEIADQLDELRAIRAKRSEVDAQLAAMGRTDRAREHREAIEQLRLRFERRSQALTQTRVAAQALGRLNSPQELLRQAPRALAQATDFERVLLSTVSGGTLIPVSWHLPTPTEPDEATHGEALRELEESPLRLGRAVVETDAIRRRRSMLVANAHGNARVDLRIAQLMAANSYLVAPIVFGPTPIGLIHAALGRESAVGVVERDCLGEFAHSLSTVHESAVLRRALLQERETVRRFAKRLNALSLSLANNTMNLSTISGSVVPPAPEPAPNTPPVAGAAQDDRLVFLGVLTPRELDVLRSLADGGTNSDIARTLVLSETTVKFHISNILRKLRVSNRAEAVASYLTRVGVGSAS